MRRSADGGDQQEEPGGMQQAVNRRDGPAENPRSSMGGNLASLQPSAEPPRKTARQPPSQAVAQKHERTTGPASGRPERLEQTAAGTRRRRRRPAQTETPQIGTGATQNFGSEGAVDLFDRRHRNLREQAHGQDSRRRATSPRKNLDLPHTNRTAGAMAIVRFPRTPQKMPTASARRASGARSASRLRLLVVGSHHGGSLQKRRQIELQPSRATPASAWR